MSIIILGSGGGTGGPATPPGRQPPAPPPPVTPPAPCPTITISPSTLPTGTVGVPYAQTLSASGGTGPYTFSFAGVLPQGLSLSPAGILSETPTVAQTVTVAIRATDVHGCFTTLIAAILIAPAPTTPCPTILLAPSSLPTGTVGVPYTQAITASGGASPYTYTAPIVPAGLTLSTSGLLSGTPTAPTSLPMAILATDANGCTGSLIVTLLLQPAPPVVITLSPAVLPAGTVGTPYSQSMSASGGTGSYTFTLLAGTLPAGLTLSAAGLVSGTPTVAVTAPLTIQATDAHGATGTIATTLSTVVAGALRLLTAADISYLGCFRMPSSIDTRFSYGNLSGRVVNGQTTLFVSGNTNIGEPIYEVVDPGTYTTDYHTAPQAALYANWGTAIYGGKRVTYRPPSYAPVTAGYVIAGGLYFNPATQLLYWTYADSYNVGGYQDWGLGASHLIDPVAGTSYAYGPWRVTGVDADGVTRYGPTRCFYLWANPFDGSLVCGASIQGGASESPWGPGLYGGLPWPTATTPAGYGNPDLALTTRSLDHYFMGNTLATNYVNPATGAVVGALRSFRRRLDPALYEQQGLVANPALNGGVTSFTEIDRTTGGIWLQLTHVRGVIYSQTVAGAVSQLTTDPLAGHAWYSNAGVDPPLGACSHGIPPPVDTTGPVMTAGFPMFAIYNPDDLAAVVNTDLDYTPEPTTVINLETTYGVQTAPITTIGGAKTLEGFYFDPVRKYLFAVSHLVDDTAGPYFVGSIIHVFAVNDAP